MNKVDPSARRTSALLAYEKLVGDRMLPRKLLAPLDFAEKLETIRASHGEQVDLVEAYLMQVGFSVFESDVAPPRGASAPAQVAHGGPVDDAVRATAGATARDKDAINRQLDEKRGEPRALHTLPSFARLALAFASKKGGTADFPLDIAAVVAKIDEWDRASVATLRNFPSMLGSQDTYHLGVIVADAMRLVRLVSTKRIDDWLASPETPEAAKTTLKKWQQAFLIRADAIGAVAAEALITSGVQMLDIVGNTPKLAKLLGKKNYVWGTLGLGVGTARLAFRERQFFAEVLGRQFRMKGWSFARLREGRLLARVNDLAGQPLITHRHAEQLRTAYAAMKERGVTGEKADALVVAALRAGEAGSGKPWKGLIRLTELIVHSDVDPAAANFPKLLQDAMTCPIHYTHVPGMEVVVRDYALGHALLKIDSKVANGESMALLQQGRGSLIPGYIRASAERTEFGRVYSKPLWNFLNSMVVAEGADHTRQRKAFLPFLSQRSVLDQAEFVEETVGRLLDQTGEAARKNGGAFDFKKDFAYNFPIRIICNIMGIPALDVPKVQKWSEDVVRAMDTEAGLSGEISLRGQRAAAEFAAYLRKQLKAATDGRSTSEMMKAIAKNGTLSVDEKVANLGVIIFAGFETTTGLLSKGISELIRRPEQWSYLKTSLVAGPPVSVDGEVVPDVALRWLAWAQTQPLRKLDDSESPDGKKAEPGERIQRFERLTTLVARSQPLAARLEAIRKHESVLDAAVEEMLRWTAPGTVVPLTASKDIAIPAPSAMEYRGRIVKAGENIEFAKGTTILVAVDELNRRCPFGGGRFDPDAKGGFDATRTDNTSHLAFGVRHECIGAFLAKENAKRALEGVLRRFPDLQLNGTRVPQDMELFSGLAALPVRSAAHASS